MIISLIDVCINFLIATFCISYVLATFYFDFYAQVRQPGRGFFVFYENVAMSHADCFADLPESYLPKPMVFLGIRNISGAAVVKDLHDNSTYDIPMSDVSFATAESRF